jgi:hypothetical protein
LKVVELRDEVYEGFYNEWNVSQRTGEGRFSYNVGDGDGARYGF